MENDVYDQVIEAVRLRLTEHKWGLLNVETFDEREVPKRGSGQPVFGGGSAPNQTVTEWRVIAQAIHENGEVRTIPFIVKRIGANFSADNPYEELRMG